MQHMRTKLRGIDGLIGREPVGAVLSVGIKGPSGNPVEKDRFHLLEPRPKTKTIQRYQKSVNIEVRDHHPRFRPFNEAPAVERQTVNCQIVHQDELQCFDYHLLAYRAKGHPSHPKRRPFCVGDGERAERYVGLVDGEHRFEDIVCPHDRCEFRVRAKTPNGLRPATCKPWGRLLFRIVWRTGNLPTTLVKWSTGGWASIKNALGFFDYVRESAHMILGDRPYTLGGFEFTLTLGEGTDPEQRTRFPVVSFSPLTDPVDFFVAQVDRFERIGQVMGPLLEHEKEPLALEHEPPEQSGQDWLDHNPGVGIE